MKHFIWIFVFFLFLACNSDEDRSITEINEEEIEIGNNESFPKEAVKPQAELNKMIIGIWKNTYLHGKKYIFDDLHTFKDDGIYIFYDGTFHTPGTWEIREGELIVKTKDEEEVLGKLEASDKTEFILVHKDGTESIYEKH